jgi:hypothetical protein
LTDGPGEAHLRISKKCHAARRLPAETRKHPTRDNAPRYGAFTGSEIPPRPPVVPEFGSNCPSSLLRMWRLNRVMSVASLVSMLRDERAKCPAIASRAPDSVRFSPLRPSSATCFDLDGRHRGGPEIVIPFHENGIAVILNPGKLAIGEPLDSGNTGSGDFGGLVLQTRWTWCWSPAGLVLEFRSLGARVPLGQLLRRDLAHGFPAFSPFDSPRNTL